MRLLPLLLGSLLAACATVAVPVTAFPDSARLAAIAEQKPVAPPFAQRRLQVAHWDLLGPLPSTIELVVHADRTPWDALVSQTVQSRPGTAVHSEDLHCV